MPASSDPATPAAPRRSPVVWAARLGSLRIPLGDRARSLVRRGQTSWPRIAGPLDALGGVPVLIGVGLLAAGVALPWLGVPLETERSSFALTLLVPGLPRLGVANYGVVELALLVAAVFVVVRRRGRSRAVVAAAGVLAMAAALCFFASTSVADVSLLQHIVNQAADLSAITDEFGYSVPRTVPDAVAFQPISGPWRLVFGQLRPGWIAAMAGGGVLFAWGARDLLAALRASRPRVRVAITAAAAVAAIALFGRPVAANLVANSASTSAQAGNYHDALQRFQLMDSLDSDIRHRVGVEEEWGATLLVAGKRDTPLALLADARAQGARGNVVQEAADLKQVVALAPDDSTVAEAYITALRRSSVKSGDPALLASLTATPVGDSPADHYTLARLYYTSGACRLADLHLTRVLDETVEPNTRSSAYTYRALCEVTLGDRGAWRADLLRAVATDVEYNNSLARSLATGLYQAQTR